jgi:hypothetical protein
MDEFSRSYHSNNEDALYASDYERDLSGSASFIQVDESEPSYDDDDENNDSYASRQSEYDDSRGESVHPIDLAVPRTKMTCAYHTPSATTTTVVSCRSMSMNPTVWTVTTMTIDQIRLSTTKTSTRVKRVLGTEATLAHIVSLREYIVHIRVAM